MRIVAGKFRSRRLLGPRSGNFRPTSDRVREAIFNLLGPIGPDVSFADIYAGSGAMGIEALSRGAGRAVWVESSGSSCWTIKKNLEELGLDPGTVVQKKASTFVAETAELFDVVFADPPYDLPIEDVLAGLSQKPILKPGGLLILEHSRRQDPPEVSGCLERYDQRRYGDTTLSLYRSRP